MFICDKDDESIYHRDESRVWYPDRASMNLFKTEKFLPLRLGALA